MKYCATYVTDMFATKIKKRVAITGELERNLQKTYFGDLKSGYEHGLTGRVLDVTRKCGNVVDIYLLYADLNLWFSITTCTNKYTND